MASSTNCLDAAEKESFPKDMKNREAVAVQIAVMLRGDLAGANPRDPAAWLPVAKKRGCRVVAFHRMDGPSGYYTQSEIEGEALIEYNTAYAGEAQARALLRGVSQHVTHFLYPSASFEPINLDCGKRDPQWKPSGV